MRPSGTVQSTRDGAIMWLRYLRNHARMKPCPSFAVRRRHLQALFAIGLAVLAIVPARADPLLTYPLRVRGHAIRAEVANTEESRRTGLMFRRSMPEDNGMLFTYERPGIQSMWMKNTLLPLSVAFIGRDGRILNIEDMKPQTLDSHCSTKPVRYVLEMHKGWFAKRGIKAGSRIAGGPFR